MVKMPATMQNPTTTNVTESDILRAGAFDFLINNTDRAEKPTQLASAGRPPRRTWRYRTL